ncbi:S-adenosyl-L-methionine-dependent methyltransferase [Dunaliella salina]|uniref:S-adenosyl-L-methionine-dependent methyltransferase n=1 Tax=Dunaliella salina TaxID=3046 RepID=A0ABQ7G5X0_DUNSA|nr:S-adenosyl-L-methionine-dependent methyltransferase [Dunaliella salina]|eukprot:KAF5830012.1 S-adenosyl-L-methionine-dependent methyltransferase [Dunaliella salina]
MRVASLFSGAGGLDLGLEQAGHTIILQCESDPGSQQVLKYWFPGTLLAPDVCALETLPLGTDLVAAGFPCIDVSRAGLRRGVEGECTGLVRHVFRLLHRAKLDGRAVPWVLLENVEALVDRVQGGPPAIQSITDALEQLGYNSWAHRVVCTAGFGISNRRRRLFLVASLHGDARDVLLSQGLQPCLGACCEHDADGKPLPTSKPCYECYQAPSLDTTDGMDKCSLAFDLGNARCPPGVDVCPTFTTSNSRICLALEKQVGIMRTTDAERLQGFPEGWTEPCWPILGPSMNMHRKPTREADSDARERARHALLGNAVSVPVAHWLGERLMDPYHKKYFGYSETTRSNNLGLWPSCAFFVRRMGRFAVQGVSDCPVKLPFEPLGTFISELISEAGDVAKKGELVWAKDVSRSNTYWPAEALDPFNLPAGVILSPAQMNPLNQRERSLYLPSTAAEAGEDAVKRAQNHRKIFVVFFGDKAFQWIFKDALIPFEPHREAKTAELEALLASRTLTCSGHFKKAMQEVNVVRNMLQGAKNLGEASTDEDAGTKTLTHPSLLSQAAQAAAAAAKMDRCNACEVCLSSQVNRRCYVVRAHSAAAAGHTGAQLAVLGRGCVGARVSCFVVDYDRFQVRHTVIYEDGDREVIALWAPNQLVRIHNTPKDWPAEAEKIRRDQEARALANSQQIAAKAQHKAKMEEEAMEASKTPYERDRDARMANNSAALQRIMAGTEDSLTPATPHPPPRESKRSGSEAAVSDGAVGTPTHAGGCAGKARSAGAGATAVRGEGAEGKEEVKVTGAAGVAADVEDAMQLQPGIVLIE